MLRRSWCLLLAMAIVGWGHTPAQALTIEIEVTPQWLGEQPDGGKEFAIDTVDKENGLVEFTISRRVFEDRYRLGRLEVRAGDELLAECLLKPEEKERLIRYHFTVSKRAVEHSVFEFSEYALVRSGDEEIGLPGGTIYRIQLGDFYRP